MGKAASSENWGIEDGKFIADEKQVNWPLPSVLVGWLVQVEEARSKLGKAIEALRRAGLDPTRWARQAGEYW